MPFADIFQEQYKTDQLSFHAMWGCVLASPLNCHILGEDFIAQPDFKRFSRIDTDWKVEDIEGPVPVYVGSPGDPPFPPTPDYSFPIEYLPECSLKIRKHHDGLDENASVEFILSRYKSEPSLRERFISRCVSHLAAGWGLVLVDTIHFQPGNLHNVLMDRLDYPQAKFPTDVSAYMSVLRPGRTQKTWYSEYVDRIDIWRWELKLGEPFPLVPLPVRNGLAVPLDLESGFEEARRGLRL